jgi:hypothetical protein
MAEAGLRHPSESSLCYAAGNTHCDAMDWPVVPFRIAVDFKEQHPHD